MSPKHILVCTASAVALTFAGSLYAETAADAEAKAATEMAKDVGEGAGAAQDVANVANEAESDVNAAAAAGAASAAEAEAADVVDEAADTAAAEMIEAKDVADEVAKEAKTDAVLKDSKTMIQGQ